MSEANESEVEKKIREIEERRAKRRKATEAEQRVQFAEDLAAFEALEMEHGDANVARLNVDGFVPGLPTFVVVKSPGGTAYYKRYLSQTRTAQAQTQPGKKAQGINEAQDQLGDACIVYPSEPDVRRKLFDQFPGVKLSAALRAIRFVELEEEEEKKG